MPSSQPIPLVHAIIPAAGRSRRMGSPKQLLDVGGATMLERMVQTLSAVDGIAVVTHAAIRAALADRLGASVVLVANDDPATEMIDSIRLGIAAWRARSMRPQDGFLVCPGDHPGLSAEDVGRCLAAFRESPDRIVVATRNGKRGHPLIFPAGLAAIVESAVCDGGLNQLVHRHAELVREVECASPGVLHDVDSPADLDL